MAAGDKGNYIIVDDVRDRIYERDIETDAWLTDTITVTGATVARGIAIEPDGDIVLVNAFPVNARIYDGTRFGSAVSLGPVQSPQGIAIPTNGDWYVMDHGSRKVRKRISGVWELASGGIAIPSGLITRGIGVDSVGNIYILSTTNRVFKYNGSTWDAGTPLPSGARDAAGLTIDYEDNWLVLCTNGIYKYTVASSIWSGPTALASEVRSPRGIAAYLDASVRLETTVDIPIGGTSSVNLTAPASVRLESIVDVEIGGQTGPPVFAPPPAVRLDTNVDIEIGGESRIDLEQPTTRLESIVDIPIGGNSSKPEFTPPDPVRLESEVDIPIGGESELNYVLPGQILYDLYYGEIPMDELYLGDILITRLYEDRTIVYERGP